MRFEKYSVFAKILAQEKITVTFQKSETAYFNLKQRVLTLPDFAFDSEAFTKMLIAHEVAHAIFTPYDGWANAVKSSIKKGYGSVLNVVEDCRIDRLIQKKYPGIGKEYRESVKHIVSSNFFNLKKDPNDYNLVNRINLFYKTRWNGNPYNIKFSPEEQIFIDDLDAMKNWEDAVAIADRLVDHLTDEHMKSMDEYEEGKDEEKSEAEKKKKQQGDLPDRFNLNERDEGDESDEEEDDGNNVAAPGLHGEPSLWDEFNNNVMGKSTPNVGVSYNVRNETWAYKTPKTPILEDKFSKRDEKKQNHSIVDNMRNQHRNFVNAFYSHFVRKQKAREYSKIAHEKTGLINVNALHSYKYNDDIFLVRDVAGTSKDYGFFILVDCSSSMSDVFRSVITSVFLFSQIAERLSIPVQIVGFTTGGKNNGPISKSKVLLYNLFDSRLPKPTNKEKLKNLLNGDIDLGGTPLADSLLLTEPLVKEMRSKVDSFTYVLISDGGDGTGNTFKHIQDVETGAIYPNGLSSRGTDDNVYAVGSLLKEKLNLNLQCIDITSSVGYIQSLNADLKDKFQKSGILNVPKHSCFDNCLFIQESALKNPFKLLDVLTSNLT